MPIPEHIRAELWEELSYYERRPRDFVYWAFPWGEPHTVLETRNTLEGWQDRVLAYIQERLQDWDKQPIRVATTSGHGIGKSALSAMFNIWGFSTFPDTRGVITANTENQLKTKTWVELSKWMRMFIAKDLFQLTATALFPNETNPAKEWRLDIVPWSEKNPDAFAGLHNKDKRVISTFDEASQIADVIWETTEGIETDADTQIIRLAFGNPTNPESYFRELFPGGKFESQWKTWKVSSLDVTLTNKVKLQEMIKIYGEDHDVVRVRIKGEFPKQAGDAFIDRDVCEKAIARPYPAINPHPVVLGIDIARMGGDSTIIVARQGMDARSRPPMVLPKCDTQQIVAYIIQAVRKWNPEIVFIDEGYIGIAILDLLWGKQMVRPQFIGVPFGGKPDGNTETEAEGTYLNKRAEIWGSMRNWLRRGCICNQITGYEQRLVEELTTPRMKLMGEDTKIQLESKTSMRSRGVPSPNWADALACTFAQPIDIEEDRTTIIYRNRELERSSAYEPFTETNIYGDL